MPKQRNERQERTFAVWQRAGREEREGLDRFVNSYRLAEVHPFAAGTMAS